MIALKGRLRKIALALLPLSLCLLPQCRLDPSSTVQEKFVTVKLHDSLARYDSVQILILAEGDTDKVVGTIWNGALQTPGSIPPFRLDDSENRVLSVRVKGFDQYGRLVLDMRISKNGDQQVVSEIAQPKPSPALASLKISQGALVPAFDPAVKAYSVALAYEQTSFTVTMTPAFAPATMLVGFTKVGAGQASAPLDAHVGTNSFSLNITAADTSTKYVLNVTRAAAPPVDTTIHNPPDTTGPVTGPGTGPGTDPNPLDALVLNWKHMGLVNLDYAQMGIGKDEVAIDFPILLRLTKDNFKLSEAADGGKDLRFATSDGRIFPYEVGRWDAIKGEADIWIKTDTLRSDGSSKSILMFWGNGAASNASDPAKVFPTQAGWSGVWHLDESSKGAAGEFKDAVGRYNGTGDGDGSALPARATGMVGYGQVIKTSSRPGAITLPSAFDPGDKAWTLSLWVKRTGSDPSILFNKSVGTGDPSTQRFQVSVTEGNGQKVTLKRAGNIDNTEIYLPQDGWLLLAIVYDGVKVHFFVDGYERESQAWTQADDPDAKVILGASDDKGNYGFEGIMDEFWSSSVPRNSSFMRFMYENQKPYSAFVTLLPL